MNIKEIILSINGLKWFSVNYLKEVFSNIEIEELDKYKCAFEVKGIPVEFNSMVMDLRIFT